jgi:putative DNA primase/helicase
MSADTATILQARHRRLAKTWRADGSCEGYDAAKHFDLHAVPLDGLDALEALLRDLGPRWDCAMVRGGIADPAWATNVRRLVHPDPETGEAATLREMPHHWLALDVDGVPLPDNVDRLDLAACAGAVLPLLPAAVGNANR